VTTSYQLAAIDIDDTLLGPDTRVSDDNARAILRLRAAGVLVVLASGRSHANMLPYHQALGLPDGPVVSAQGAVVRDSASGEVLHLRAMTPEQVTDVTVRGRALGFSVLHYTLDAIQIEGYSEWQQIDQVRNATPHALVADLLSEPLDAITKIIWMGPVDYIARMVPEARAALGDRVAVIPTDPNYLEFAGQGVHKAVGLEALAARLGVPREAVLAFGDGLNDVEMLAWAGRGVAMSHARPEAKEAAALVAPDGPHASSLARAIDLALS
jgi:Cof subfamily protein (haloacid dehalogenase superfamily)